MQYQEPAVRRNIQARQSFLEGVRSYLRKLYRLSTRIRVLSAEQRTAGGLIKQLGIGILMRPSKTFAKLALRTASNFLNRSGSAGLYTRVHSNLDIETHIAEARDWLCRAQDHGSDRGVSYGARLGENFLPSYPETTGYIICSFLDLANYYGEESYLARAIAMGEWETRIQMDCGAVMGGMYHTDPTPAVFNTGMVLLGWAALYRATGDDCVRAAGQRAGRWLMEMQEPNGQWIRGNSRFANSLTTVYNVKAAWGLAEMGMALGNPAFLRAAERNAEFALSRQLANGWFRDCCLEDAGRPLLHTLAYTMQGLIGVGSLSGRSEFLDAAVRTASSPCLKSLPPRNVSA